MTQQVIARSGYWSSLGRSLNQRADARDSSARSSAPIASRNLRFNTLRVNSPLATVGALSNPRSFVTADAMDDERAALGERLGLSDPALIRNRCYVNGRWLGAASGDTFPVHNPATREKLISVPNLSADETHTAIADAAAAFPSWSSMTAAARSTMLRRWHDLIVQHSDDLAKIMVAEQASPRAKPRARCPTPPRSSNGSPRRRDEPTARSSHRTTVTPASSCYANPSASSPR